jgi:hypothetical protein
METNKTEINKTEEFFKKRFPERDIELEKKHGYFQTWERRLSSEHPEEFMDEISQKVWKEMEASE